VVSSAASQVALKTEIASLSTSQSSSSGELGVLKRRVEETEREKRDRIGVISRLKQESSQYDGKFVYLLVSRTGIIQKLLTTDEIHTLRSNLKEARQEHQYLEAQVGESRSTETSTLQQLQLSQAEAERATYELMSKSEEFAKYRHVKHAEFVRMILLPDTCRYGEYTQNPSVYTQRAKSPT
jgi:nucleoprotein TPR